MSLLLLRLVRLDFLCVLLDRRCLCRSLLMVTPPLAVCANAPDANPKDINRIGKSFFMGNSLFVKGVLSTRQVGSWMTAETRLYLDETEALRSRRSDGDGQMARIREACGPFWPCVTSNSTRWFSESVLKPSP